MLAITTGEDISSLKRIVRNRKVDGLILTRPLAGDKAIAYLGETSLPFVVIGSPENRDVHHVDSNHRSGCMKATEHVLDSGFVRHVLLGGNPDHRVNRDRLTGYLDAVKKYGGEDNGGLRQLIWGMEGQREIEAVLPGIMKNRPDCLICMDDVIATHVLAWLYRKGFTVPDDVALVSFHDSTVMESYHPSVSALHINVQNWHLAGNTIIDLYRRKTGREGEWCAVTVLIGDSPAYTRAGEYSIYSGRRKKMKKRLVWCDPRRGTGLPCGAKICGAALLPSVWETNNGLDEFSRKADEEFKKVSGHNNKLCSWNWACGTLLVNSAGVGLICLPLHDKLGEMVAGGHVLYL